MKFFDELDPQTGEIIRGEDLGRVGGKFDLADEKEDAELEKTFLFRGQRTSSDMRGRQELYETPIHATQSIIEALIEKLPNNEDLKYYDCACGNKAIVNVMIHNGFDCIGTDLYTQSAFVDYLKDEIPNHDFIITNPPFNQANEFLQKAYDSKKPFLMLLPIDCLGTKKKHLMFHMYGVIVYCIFPKPKFLHEGKHVQIDNTGWFYGNSGLVGEGEIIIKNCGLFEN